MILSDDDNRIAGALCSALILLLCESENQNQLDEQSQSLQERPPYGRTVQDLALHLVEERVVWSESIVCIASHLEVFMQRHPGGSVRAEDLLRVQERIGELVRRLAQHGIE